MIDKVVVHHTKRLTALMDVFEPVSGMWKGRPVSRVCIHKKHIVSIPRDEPLAVLKIPSSAFILSYVKIIMDRMEEIIDMTGKEEKEDKQLKLL